MIDNFMPDIPRINTALAEWLACMIFILPLAKRFTKYKTAAIMAAAFVIQSVFLVSTGNIRLYFWVPCMVMAAVFMIGFIFS